MSIQIQDLKASLAHRGREVQTLLAMLLREQSRNTAHSILFFEHEYTPAHTRAPAAGALGAQKDALYIEEVEEEEEERDVAGERQAGTQSFHGHTHYHTLWSPEASPPRPPPLS